MVRVIILAILVIMFAGYSALVYTVGTESGIQLSGKEVQEISHGKQLFQENNCMSCHQLYGLGGFLGPDLTIAYSDKKKGEAYMRAMLQSGGARMPAYHFKTAELNSIIAYLKYVDSTATPVKSIYR